MGQKSNACLCILGTPAVLCFLIPGILMFFKSRTMGGEVDQMDPADDFKSLANPCKITDVKHTSRSKEDRSRTRMSNTPAANNAVTKYSCVDEYTYKFTTPVDNFVTVYSSSIEVVTRNAQSAEASSKCLSTQVAAPGAFATGEAVTTSSTKCWKATASDGLSEHYQCGNDKCYKIFDPAADHAVAGEAVGLLWYLSLILIGMACCIGSVCVFCCFCMNASEAAMDFLDSDSDSS